MSKINKCRSGKDFLALAEKAEREGRCKVRKCKSSHVIVKNEKGATTIPVHGNKQLGTGIRLNIAKAFRLMGLAVMAVMIIQGVI